jgi:hypothetical protein
MRTFEDKVHNQLTFVSGLGFRHKNNHAAGKIETNLSGPVFNIEFRLFKPILSIMKSSLILPGLFLGLSLLRLPALGQTAAPTNGVTSLPPTAASRAAAVAEQQGVDEKFKQMAADIETLRTANQLLLEKLSVLREELQHLRAEQARLAAGAISRDDLKPLAQSITEVDKRRQEDKDTITEQIKKMEPRLEALVASAIEAAVKSPAKTPAASNPPAAEKPYIHIVLDGETLEAIRVAYNKEFKTNGMKTVTLQQCRDANPGVDCDHLKVGQKVVIPHPPE